MKLLKPKLIAARKEEKKAYIKYDKLIIEGNMKKITIEATNDCVCTFKGAHRKMEKVE